MLAYVIRHAQSLGNAQEESGLDTGLSPLGILQTEALAARLSRVKAEAVYSSPFYRCVQTAVPIARALHMSVRIRPELCEFHASQPGTPHEPILPALPEILGRQDAIMACPDHQGPMNWPHVDEPLDSLIDRMRTLACYLKGRWQGEDDVVILISHGSPIARLIDAWLTDQPGPSFRFIIDNAAISALRFHRGVSSLVCLNDMSHLAGRPTPEASNFREDGTIKPAPPSAYW